MHVDISLGITYYDGVKRSDQTQGWRKGSRTMAMSIAEAYAKGLLRAYCVSPSCSREADRDSQYCTMHRLERGETVICEDCREAFRLTESFPCITCGCDR